MSRDEDQLSDTETKLDASDYLQTSLTELARRIYPRSGSWEQAIVTTIAQSARWMDYEALLAIREVVSLVLNDKTTPKKRATADDMEWHILESLALATTGAADGLDADKLGVLIDDAEAIVRELRARVHAAATVPPPVPPEPER